MEDEDGITEDRKDLTVLNNADFSEFSYQMKEKALKIVKNSLKYFKFVAHTSEITKILIDIEKKKLFSSSRDGCIILWDLSTHSQEKTILKGNKAILDMQLTKDNRFLVITREKDLLNIIDLDSHDHLMKVFQGSEGTTLTRFSKCTKFLACLVESEKIVIWDFEKQEQIKMFLIEKETFQTFNFTVDLKNLLVLNERSEIFYFSLEGEGRRCQRYPGVNCFATGNISGKVATACSEGSVFIYLDEKVTMCEAAHLSFIAFLEFNYCDEYLISSSYDKTVKIHMASFPMQTIKVIKCHSTALTLAFPKDLSTIYMGYKVNVGQNTINKFLIKEDSFVGGFDGHSSSLSKMIFYRDFSKVLTDAGDGGLRLWDLDLKIQLKLIDVKLGFRDYSLSFNEKMIAFSAQSKMFVWNIDENKIIFSIDFDDFSIVSVFFICFDKFIVVHTSNILSFILVDTQKIIRRVKYNRIWLTSVLKVNEKLFVQNFGKKIFKVWGVNEEKQNKYVEFNNSSSDIVSGTLSKSKSYLVLTNLVYHCYVLKHH